MELLLNDEQRMLQDSAAKLLARAGGVTRARALRGRGYDRDMLRQMAGEGWLGILAPPESGGLGLGLTELALVLEQAGRTLAPEPVAVSALAAAALAGAEWATPVVEGILSGERIVALGLAVEPDALRAVVKGSTAMLDGAVDGVTPAADCDGYLVAASTERGPILAHVPRGAEGTSLSLRATVDGRQFGRLDLNGVQTAEIVTADAAATLGNRALVAAAAELLGVMSAALDMTVEYLKTRQQFGKPIGSFQALQHRAVDCYTRIASTRSLLHQICAQGPAPSSAMASALKAHASAEALAVTKAAIQLHGAIGYTDEFDAGLYLKRAMWLSAWLGNEAAHRMRYAAMMA